MSRRSVRSPARHRAAGESRERQQLARWLLIVAAVVIVASIGLPLVGVRVFLATDALRDFAPWRDVKPELVAPTNPLLGDTFDSGVPAHVEFRRRVLAGDFPGWMPFTSGGAPLGVVPDNALMSPLNLPYLVFPVWYAPAAAKLLEMTVGVGFCFLFLRRLGLSRAAGLFGGLVYADSGFQVVWTNWPQAHVGALIPALFWSVERASASRRPRDAVPIALVVATMLLEGFPAITLYALVSAAVYLGVRLLARRPRPSFGSQVNRGLLAGAGVLAGAGIAAFQLLPFAAHLGNLHLSYRVFHNHLPISALETLIFPNVTGSPAARTWFGTINYVELQSFIGAAAMILVVAGVVRRSRTSVVPGAWGFVYGGIALTGILIYGGGPMLKIVQALPLIGMNFIGRLRSVFGFCLAAAAAMGFDAVERADARRRAERWVWPVVAAAVLVLFVHVWVVVHARPERGYVLRQALVPVIAVAGAFVLVTRSAGSPRWTRWAAVGLPVLVAMESLAFVLPFWPRVARADYYPVTSAHQFLTGHLHGDRLAASQITMDAGTTTVYGIRSVTSHAFQTAEWNDLMTTIDSRAFARSPTRAVLSGTPAVAASPILDRLGARYFAVDPSVRIFGRQPPPRPAKGTTVLRPARPVELPVAVPGLRGVSLSVIGHVSAARRPLITASVLDARGAMRGTGTRRIPAGFAGGELWVPIAGEPGAGRLRLSITDATGLTLRTDAAGRPLATPVAARADGLRLAFAGPAVIYERLNALPRVRWASKSRVVERGSDRLRLLGEGVPADTVLLHGSGAAASGRPAVLRRIRDEGDEIVIEADAQGFGYVEIADALQHGWRATLDGRAAPLMAADHALVAVPTPAGRHEIRLAYDPKGLRTGVIVSVLSLALTLGTLVFDRRRHGRPTAMKDERS